MFTAIFIFTLGAMLTLKLWLAMRQIRYVRQHRNVVPAQFQHTTPLPKHQRAADYTIACTFLAVAEVLTSAAILVVLTLLGGLQALNSALTSWLGTGYVGQISLIAAVLVIGSLADLPFTYIRQFVIDERFDFNRMTKTLFLLDLVKGSVLSAILGLPLIFAVLWLMQQAGQGWWLWAAGLWMGFNLLALVLYPTLIAPLFNRFEPLRDETLRVRIENLLKRCQFAAKGLFVMDGSRRSTHGNAYFVGLGAAKRIVFFDTLLARLSNDEIEAVLAHELGHYKRHHITKGLIVMCGMSFALFALLGWLAQCTWFYTGLGVTPSLTESQAHIALTLFFLVLPIFLFFLSPVAKLLSRRNEFEADAFSASLTPADDLVRALVKLHEDNATTLTPDPIYSTFYYSHPPAAQRIAHLLALRHTAQITQ